jgi:hypothetical protein
VAQSGADGGDTVSAKLQGPPSEPVEWFVTYKDQDGYRHTAVIVARTAWLAHVEACPMLPGSPPFGSCNVDRGAW